MSERVLVATWNVNGIRARSQRLAEWLAERQPDIVCLQELKIVETEFPHLELRASGYHAVVVGPAELERRRGPRQGAPRDRDARAARAPPRQARASSSRRSHGLEVASVYIPNGKTLAHADYKVKLAWLESLALHVEARARSGSDVPLLVGGDFNVCPTDLDSFGGARFKGHIFHTDEERALDRAPPRRRARRSLSLEVPRRRSASRGGTTAPARSTRTRACGSTCSSRARRSRPA